MQRSQSSPTRSFPERSAHLSYVAPLIGALLLQQLGAHPWGVALVAVLGMGGLFSALTGLRFARREHQQTSRPALLGLVLNLAFLVGLGLWLWLR